MWQLAQTAETLPIINRRYYCAMHEVRDPRQNEQYHISSRLSDCWTGVALYTEFALLCADWLNPATDTADRLSYLSWLLTEQAPSGRRIFSHGSEPAGTRLTLPAGEAEHDFRHQVVVRIVQPLGDFHQMTLSVKVRVPSVITHRDVLYRGVSVSRNAILFENVPFSRAQLGGGGLNTPPLRFFRDS